MQAATQTKVTVHQGSSNDHSAATKSSPDKDPKLKNNSSFHAKPKLQGGSGDNCDDSSTNSLGFNNFGKISILPPQSFRLQPKLKINPNNDSYEIEADRVAQQVMSVQKQGREQKCSKCQKKESLPLPAQVKIQSKCAKCQEEEAIMTKSKGNSGHTASQKLTNQIQNSRGRGRPMDSQTQAFMESRFGTDFSSVKVHTDAGAVQMNRSIHSKAFTVGRDIFFNQGTYNPKAHEGKKLLAHELTHVVQQSGYAKTESEEPAYIQRKGGTFRGFFRNIFLPDSSISDDTINAYITYLEGGEIEDDYDSDDKARVVVKKWKAGTLTLLSPQKILLIREMFSGVTGNPDEQAILDLLNGSPGELTYIFSKIKPAEFRSKLHGKERKQLEFILEPWEKRKAAITSEPLQETSVTKHSESTFLGDNMLTRLWKSLLSSMLTPIGLPAIEVDEGMKLEEFDRYISKQADWFTEPELRKNETARNQLWDIVFLLGEGSHIGTALGQLRLPKILGATTNEIKALRSYAEGANLAIDMVRISAPHDNFETVVTWGKAMKELKSFVPGPVLKKVIDQDMLDQMINESTGSLIPEFKKYYKEFTPTLEARKERDPILALLREGIDPYMSLKDWIHDLHTFEQDTRLQLMLNIQQTNKTNKTKSVLLVLMSGLDHNSAFLNWGNLRAAIQNTKNLTLVIQGAQSISSLTARVKEVARDYGLITPPDTQGRIRQVVIAGHGQAKSVQQATSGVPAVVQDEENVKYESEGLHPQKKGDDSEVLIDTILQILEPKDARVVFAGCLVGSHELPIETKLADTSTAAHEINLALKANPNLQDLVVQRMKAPKIKAIVQAANATTIADTFRLNTSGDAELFYSKDPAIGATKADYVQKGKEPEGALRAALETWADKKYGPSWTTNAMRTYVTANSANTGWWTTITRIAYATVLPATGDVKPVALNYLSHWVAAWFFVGYADLANAKSLAITVANTEKLKPVADPKSFPIPPILYPAMLASDWSNRPQVATVVYQAWLSVDATKANDLLNAIGNSALKGSRLYHFLELDLFKAHLPVLLKTADPKNPSKAQLKLAFNIAENMKTSMPEAVQVFLRNAAGNITTTSFPATLNVKDYLEISSEFSVIKDLGLAPGSTSAPATTGSTSFKPSKKDANADFDKDQKNESFITVKPQKLFLSTDAPVWEKPDPNSKILTTLKKGETVRIAGTTSGWAVIDFNGKAAFVDIALIS